MRLIDLTGKRFGKLVVTKRDYKTQQLKKDKEVWWHCICDCGNTEYSARGHDLRDGRIVSCGCKKKENVASINFKDLTGQRFGKLTVLRLSPIRRGGHCYWVCQCDCGSPLIEVGGTHLTRGDTCSCGCMISNGERKLIEILNALNIEYATQKSFDDCTYKKILKFDFYLPLYNMVIEYNGIQHYKPVKHFGGEERFKKQQARDKIKEDWCKDHNITLISIPYTDFSKLSNEYVKNLIESKGENK